MRLWPTASRLTLASLQSVLLHHAWVGAQAEVLLAQEPARAGHRGAEAGGLGSPRPPRAEEQRRGGPAGENATPHIAPANLPSSDRHKLAAFHQADAALDAADIVRISHLQYLLSASAAAVAAHVWASLRVKPTPVWVHGGSTPQVAGLQACEEAAHEDATPERFLEPWQKDGWRLRGFVRDQLLEAGVQDAGAIWGTEREATHPVYALCC